MENTKLLYSKGVCILPQTRSVIVVSKKSGLSFALWRGTEDWTDCWSCFYMEEVNNNSGVAAATTSQITFPFVTVNIFATAAADTADP